MSSGSYLIGGIAVIAAGGAIGAAYYGNKAYQASQQEMAYLIHFDQLLGGIAGNISTINKEVAPLAGDLSTLNSELPQISSEISGLATSQQNANALLSKIQGALSPLTTIDATLSGLKNDILGVPNDILKNPIITGISSSLSNQYKLLQTTYLLTQAGEKKLISDISALPNDISAVGPAVINQLSKDYTNFTNSFNALKSVVTSLPDASAITGLLNSEMSPLTNDMKNLSSGIGNINSGIGGLNTSIGGDMGNLNKGIEGISSGIGGLNTGIGNLGSSIGNIRNGISGIDSTVQGLPDLSSIQGAFNSGFSGISSGLSSLAQSIPSNTSSGASSVTSDISRIFRGL